MICGWRCIIVLLASRLEFQPVVVGEASHRHDKITVVGKSHSIELAGIPRSSEPSTQLANCCRKIWGRIGEVSVWHCLHVFIGGGKDWKERVVFVAWLITSAKEFEFELDGWKDPL